MKVFVGLTVPNAIVEHIYVLPACEYIYPTYHSERDIVKLVGLGLVLGGHALNVVRPMLYENWTSLFVYAGRDARP
jgi:hypothetical protein